MLNGFNCRANAARVIKVGANRNELHGAVAIEMSPFATARAEQMQANIDLAKRSKGLLPAPTGKENLLSLGTGHMCGFVRCALAGLQAKFTTLADKTGKISMPILLADPEFAIMVQTGWSWRILQWQAEATWPSLPEFFQRALNASNGIAAESTEWEAAITLGEIFNSMEEPSWQVAEEALLAQDPVCSGYLGCIRTLVEKYGGGGSFPLIAEQEEFYKTLSANRRLGEAFTKAIVDTKLDEYCPRLHVRHALIALNLTSQKTEDGIVKFVYKSHIQALASKDKRPIVARADEELDAGRAFLLELAAKSRISAEQFIELLGLFRIRYGGYLTNLSKQTFEGIAYNNATEIVGKLLKETTAAIKAHNNLAGDKVEIPLILRSALTYDDKPAEPRNTSKPTEADKDKSKALTIDEATSYAQAVKDRKRMEIGGMVTMTKSHPNRLNGIYTIMSIGASVHLTEVDCFKDHADLVTVKIAFDEFMKTWQEYKGEVPVRAEGSWSLVYNSFSASIEELKANLYIELKQLALENENPPLDELVLLQFKPSCIRARSDLPKAEIVLYPTVSSIAQIGTKASDSAYRVQTSFPRPGGKVDLYVCIPPQPKSAIIANWRETECVSPPKWLLETADSNIVNMEQKEHKIRGFVIPFWVSTRALKKHEKLFVMKPAKRKAAELDA